MKQILILIGFVVFLTLSGTFFVVNQVQQALVLQFGEPRQEITEPGLKFKIPFINDVVYYDTRVLNLDPQPEEMILSDQKRIIVDSFARYKINPLETNQRWSFDVLQEITLSVPANIDLREISYSGERNMVLKGVTKNQQSVHDFTIALQESNTIESAQVGAIADESGSKAKTFSVKLELRGPESES